ncbi:hypothetical protein [uncultured Bifidobacterium sp.]|uniref:hypothetical protein n=1 Tax=uncultured Bifidobacterium sp. TaxID=165187 RepID=UPI00262BDD4E|nr:hypothetical protein [uncultured Bifidobacterium sp.]
MNECYPPAPGHDPHELSCEEYHHRHPIDRAAPDCDDQLPTISTVGRGPQGYGYKVEISDPDTCTETYLEGFLYDPVTGEYKSEWKSENINGGELSYQYNLRPHTIPRTFTITFIYRRPGRCEWSWTTPAIPYVWTLDPAGKPDEDPDHVVGSGIATLLVKTCHEGDWNYEPTPDGFDKETGKSHHERLWYPMGPDGERTTRDQFNAPLAEEGWSATLVFGRGNGEMGGTIDVPDFDDLANWMGMSKQDIIYNILDKGEATFPDGIDATDYTDWILKHMHKDMGFFEGGLGHDWDDDFGGCGNIKDYIDWAIEYAIKHMTTTGDSKFNNLLPKPVRYVSGDDTKDDTNSDIVYDKQLTDADVVSGNKTINVNGSGTVSAKWVVIRSEIGMALGKVSIANPLSTGVTFNISFDMNALKCYEEVYDPEGKPLKGTILPARSYPSWQCGMSRGDGTTWIRDFSGSINGSCPDGSVSGSCYIPYTNNCTGGNYADLTIGGYRSGDQNATMYCTGHLDAGQMINLTVPYFFGNY